LRGVGGSAGGDGGKQRRNSSISQAVLARSSSEGDFGRAGDSFRNVKERVRRAGILSFCMPFDLPCEAVPTGDYGGSWLIRPDGGGRSDSLASKGGEVYVRKFIDRPMVKDFVRTKSSK